MYAKHMPMPARKKLVDIVDVDVGPLNRMTAPAFAAADAATQLSATGRRRKRAGAVKKSRNESLGSRIQLRCTAIQKFLLDHTQGSEKRIRETFGDNPDTSKALRMLVKLHRVKRFGSGGKSDPFVYMALIPPGMSELERLEEANAVGMI